MDEEKDVLPINSLIGMPVLSLATGNKLGQVEDLFIDPVNGVLLGITLVKTDGVHGSLGYDDVYSFGHDAIMARADVSVRPPEQSGFAGGVHAKDLVNTKIITESGNILGQIAGVFVTLKPPPLIVYSVRDNMLDKLLGREFFILAASGHALSDDNERLVVPDETAAASAPTIAALINKDLSVRSFPPNDTGGRVVDDDPTLLTPPGNSEFETVITGDDDDTVIRLRRDPGLKGSID
jgi:uncharacterized protein YrrD